MSERVEKNQNTEESAAWQTIQSALKNRGRLETLKEEIGKMSEEEGKEFLETLDKVDAAEQDKSREPAEKIAQGLKASNAVGRTAAIITTLLLWLQTAPSANLADIPLDAAAGGAVGLALLALVRIRPAIRDITLAHIEKRRREIAKLRESGKLEFDEAMRNGIEWLRGNEETVKIYQNASGLLSPDKYPLQPNAVPKSAGLVERLAKPTWPPGVIQQVLLQFSENVEKELDYTFRTEKEDRVPTMSGGVWRYGPGTAWIFTPPSKERA